MGTRLVLLASLAAFALSAAPALAREAASRYVKADGHVLVYEGSGGPRSYTIETNMVSPEAICYFEGVEVGREGDSEIARNTEGCEIRLTFAGDEVSVKYFHFDKAVCDVCGSGMVFNGTYTRALLR